MDTIVVLDSNLNVIDILSNNGIKPTSPFFDDTYTQDLSTGAETYEFSTITNMRTSVNLQVGNYVLFKYDGKFKLFQIMQTEDTHKEGEKTLTCYCEMAGLELLTDYAEPFRVEGNVVAFMQTVLQDTNWQLGRYSASLEDNIQVVESKSNEKVYSLIQKNIETFGMEIEFRVEFVSNYVAGFFIDCYAEGERGNKTFKRFEYGENVKGIVRKRDLNDFASASIGEGKGGIDFKEIEWSVASGNPCDKPLGQNFVVDIDANDRYNKLGKYIKDVYKSDTEDPMTLLIETWNHLQEVKEPRFDYDVELGLTNVEYEDLKIGDTNYIVDFMYSPAILLEARVGKLVLSFSDETKNKCTLSNYKELFSYIYTNDEMIDNIINGYFPIGGESIKPGAVGENHVMFDSISAKHIQANSIIAGHIQAGIITGNHIEANTIAGKHIQAGSIEAGSGIIADGAIGSAQISTLDAGKITAGTVDTSMVTVAGPNSNLKIRGNRLQVFKGLGSQQVERVSLGDVNGDGTVYGFRVRGEDGQTILIDENGVKQEGITDGSINNDKISGDANIDGAKLNINSVVRKINEDGTEVISGAKIEVEGSSLNAKLSTITNKQTEHTNSIAQNSSNIKANENSIKLKVDEQIYTQDKTNMTNTLNKNTVAIEVLQKNIVLKVEETDITNAINAEGTVTDSKIVSAKAEMKLEVDKLQLAFTQSGGYNRLKNGLPNPKGTDGWFEAEYNLIGNNLTRYFQIRNNEWSGYEPALEMNIADMISGEWRICQEVDTVVGQCYILTGYIAGHRSKKGIYIRSEAGNEWDITVTKDYANEIAGGGNGSDYSGWEKIEIPFIAGRTNTKVEFIIKGGTNAFLWAKKLMLTEGNTVTPWSPNPNEIYDGITTIDRDGVKVEMIDGEGSQGYATLSYDGIATYDNNGNTKSWFGADDSAYIKELNVDNINNPHVIQCKPRTTNWYVGVTATGDGSGRDTSNKSNSIQSVLEKVRNDSGAYNYKQDVTINCDSGMNLNENIYIGGWIGTGIISINFGAGSTFTGYIRVEECTSPVILNGNKTDWNTNNGCKWYRTDGNNGSVALYVRNSTVLCKSFRIHRGVGLNTYGNSFVSSDCGSRVTLYNNDLVKYWSIGKVTNASELYIDSTRGDVGIISEGANNSTLCARAQLPIFNNGKKVEGAYNSLVNIDGTEGNNSLWMPKNSPTPPPTPSGSWKWVEKTFSFNLSSTVEGSGSATSTWSGKWGQGKYGSYKPHRGHAIPTENIKSWCNVGSNTRNISMTLTMTRLNTSHGQAGAVPKPKLRQKDGSYWDCGVAFARGDTKSITLPAGVVSGLSDGALSELTMWAGTSTTEYSQYNNVTVKVKCEKYY
ncbi:MAG: phage tail spike protein [Sarcina sp.]